MSLLKLPVGGGAETPASPTSSSQKTAKKGESGTSAFAQLLSVLGPQKGKTAAAAPHVPLADPAAAPTAVHPQSTASLPADTLKRNIRQGHQENRQTLDMHEEIHHFRQGLDAGTSVDATAASPADDKPLLRLAPLVEQANHQGLNVTVTALDRSHPAGNGDTGEPAEGSGGDNEPVRQPMTPNVPIQPPTAKIALDPQQAALPEQDPAVDPSQLAAATLPTGEPRVALSENQPLPAVTPHEIPAHEVTPAPSRVQADHATLPPEQTQPVEPTAQQPDVLQTQPTVKPDLSSLLQSPTLSQGQPHTPKKETVLARTEASGRDTAPADTDPANDMPAVMPAATAQQAAVPMQPIGLVVRDPQPTVTTALPATPAQSDGGNPTAAAASAPLPTLQALLEPRSDRMTPKGPVQDGVLTEQTTVGTDKKGETARSETVAAQQAEAIQPSTAKELGHKIAAARETINNFATSLAQAVTEYKPPMTKISMELKPENMGSVEVTLVQRGSSMHVTVQSNPQALFLMASGSGDLKQALVNTGFGDVQMQFNFSGGNGQQQKQQQQTGWNNYQRLADEEFNLADQTTVQSLELVIPRYV